jgi:hypothetical protein
MASLAIPQRQLFIDGEWRAPALGRRLPVVNPTTEAAIGTRLTAPPIHPALLFFCSPFAPLSALTS